MVKDITPTESKETSSTKAIQSTTKQPKASEDKMSEEETKRAYETIKNGGIDDVAAEPDIEDDSKEQTSLFK